jgi:hypothetical protein
MGVFHVVAEIGTLLTDRIALLTMASRIRAGGPDGD